MDDQTADRLIALWKSGENKLLSFFKVLDDVRLEIGNDALPIWCRREIGFSLEIILDVAKLLKRAKVKINDINLKEAKKAEKEQRILKAETVRQERELKAAEVNAEKARLDVERAAHLAEKARLDAEAEKIANRSKVNARRRAYEAGPNRKGIQSKRCKDYRDKKKAEKGLASYPDLNSPTVLALTTEAIRGDELASKGEREEAHGRELWIEGSIIRATTMVNARQLFGSDNVFGQWLSAAKLDRFSKDDRAALINLGRAPNLREMLSGTNSRSYQHIWRSRAVSSNDETGNVTALFPQQPA